jgi:hypothetical protein
MKFVWFLFSWTLVMPTPGFAQQAEKLSPEMVRDSLQWILDDLGTKKEVEERTGVQLREQLLPHLTTKHAKVIHSALVSSQVVNEKWALDLLLDMRISQSLSTLKEMVLEGSLRPTMRVKILDRVLAVEGRSAFLYFRPFLRKSGEDALLRWLFQHWGQWVTSEDLPLLQELVEVEKGFVREFSLQTWAKIETRTSQRAMIFQQAMLSEYSFQTMALRTLALQGKDPGLAKQVLALLDTGRRESHRLALELIPAFGEPKDLWMAYQERKAHNFFLLAEEHWIPALVRGGGLEGKRRALAWLEEQEGRRSRALGQVMMALEKNSFEEVEVRDFLESPTEVSVKTHLALAWSATSLAAQDFLRSEWPEMNAMGLDLAFSQLAKVKDPRDAPFFFEVIQNKTVASSSRAGAVYALEKNPNGASFLLSLATDFAFPYEVQEALVWACIRQGDVDLRRIGLSCVQGKQHEGDSEEQRGLLHAAWGAQRANPRMSEVDNLFSTVQDYLSSPEACHPGPLPDPSHLVMEHADLFASAQAWIKVGDPAIAGTFRSPHACRVLTLAHAFEEDSPIAALAVLGNLHTSMTPVLLSSRIRLRAMSARLFMAQGDAESAAAYLLSLADLSEEELNQNLSGLGYGLRKASARGWVWPKEELMRRYELASAMKLAERASGETGFQGLLRSWSMTRCAPELYAQAVLFAEQKGWSATAKDFLKEGLDWYPDAVELRRGR